MSGIRRFNCALVLGALLSSTAFAADEPAGGWYYGGEIGIHSLEDAANRTRSSTTAAAGDCIIDLSFLIPGVNALCDDASITPGAPQNYTTRYDGGYFLAGTLGFAFQNGWRPELSLAYRSNDFESVRLNSGFGAANGGTASASGKTTALSLMANAWYDFAPFSEKWRPYAGLGLGTLQADVDGFRSGAASVSDDDLVWAYQLGGGIGYQYDPLTTISADLRLLSTEDPSFSGPAAPIESEYKSQSIGVSVRRIFKQIPPPDEDGDGVEDALDLCPGSPAGSKVNEKGCPLDSDRDGVTDDKDNCPGTPEGVSVNESGCPLDSDGDGVTDDKDKCPGTPAGTTVDADGCPAGEDSDGDGVPDAADRCPGTPAGTPVGADGCPSSDASSTQSSDADGDGVADGADFCPNTPAGAPVMSTGCSVSQSAVLSGVVFEYDTATLTEGSKGVLDNVAASIKKSAGFKVEIQGHTCDLGADAYNLGLSQRRADSVMAYLKSTGVDASRLTSKGYGETRPAVPNINLANRKLNRRVELMVTEGVSTPEAPPAPAEATSPAEPQPAPEAEAPAAPAEAEPAAEPAPPEDGSAQ